jgi:hypothetical protein
LPEPPCKPAVTYCRCGSRSRAPERDKWAETLERVRLAAMGRDTEATS